LEALVPVGNSGSALLMLRLITADVVILVVIVLGLYMLRFIQSH
jgi:hypothetical protein